MSTAAWWRSAFSRLRRGKAEQPPTRDSRAFLVFANTGEVMHAEKLLVRHDIPVTIMAPPPALRTGCDMVLVIPLTQVFRALTELEKGSVPPLRAVPVGEGMLEPASLFQTKDFGLWLMVRAANMKITVEKRSGRIVNVSGGGCPDVPYLAARLIGRHIREAELIREHGRTLCGYALYLAARKLERLHDRKAGPC
jgi:hypothetical protein